MVTLKEKSDIASPRAMTLVCLKEILIQEFQGWGQEQKVISKVISIKQWIFKCEQHKLSATVDLYRRHLGLVDSFMLKMALKVKE